MRATPVVERGGSAQCMGPDSQKYPILVVDDEADNLDAFRFNFKKTFPIVTAGGGEEALRILEAQDVAVIVTDQRMPKMSGLELLKAARPLRPDAVGIILTAFTDVDVRERRPVAVLGWDIADKLFDYPAQAIGQRIRVRGLQLEIRGVVEKKGTVLGQSPGSARAHALRLPGVARRHIGEATRSGRPL